MKKVLSKYMEITNTPSNNLFATKPERGVVIMTETASMAADESRPKRSNMAKRYEDGVIHKIKD